MNGMKLTRRKFIVGTSAIGAGLSLGILPQLSSAAPGMEEVNAWVHIASDDTVTIRIARSEMGQGTLTGLAPLTCEGARRASRIPNVRFCRWR